MGRNAIALFLAYDRMPAETTLKFKQASNLKPDPIYMGSTFIKGVEYGSWMEDHIPMPSQADLNRRFRTVYWPVEPGDVLAFTQRTLHAGPVNTLPTRRHATSFNVVGDGARYDARPGPVDAPGGLDPQPAPRIDPTRRALPLPAGAAQLATRLPTHTRRGFTGQSFREAGRVMDPVDAALHARLDAVRSSPTPAPGGPPRPWSACAT